MERSWEEEKEDWDIRNEGHNIDIVLEASHL